jgi:hypothetical protein
MRPEDVKPIVWTGTPERAAEIDAYTRVSSLLARWQYNPALHAEARLLVEPEEGDLTASAEWKIVPVGASIYRTNRDEQDSPLRIRPAVTAPFAER